MAQFEHALNAGAGDDTLEGGLGKDILEWFNRGEKLSGIADRLNRLGVKTVRGGKWQATSVKRIISNLNAQAV